MFVRKWATTSGLGSQLEPHRAAEVIRVCCPARIPARDRSTRLRFEEKEYRVAIRFAGITVLEDMFLSIMVMSLRVYYHHKVRLCERITERIYTFAVENDILNPLLDTVDLSGVLNLVDSELMDGSARRRVRDARASVCLRQDLSRGRLVAYDALFQPSQWLDALRDSKQVCYVYAPRRFAHVVHAAAELVLARRFGAMSQCLREAYSRHDPTELNKLRRRPEITA